MTMVRNLLDYIPHVLRTVREMRLEMDAEQPEVAALWKCVEDAFADQYVQDATENGVSRWEKILNIVPKATETLDARKFTILTRLNEQLPFTITTLEQQLAGLCGKDGYFLTLTNETYTLDVQVALVAKSNLVDVDTMLHRVVPANMIINLSLKYNQYETLKQFTHGYMKKYTHNQLRNEVLS